MAAAFTGTLSLRGDNGKEESYYCTVSDVAGANWIHQDGNGYVYLPTTWGKLRLIDVQSSSAGTDTTHAEMWVNGKRKDYDIYYAGNLTTNRKRQYLYSNIYFTPGARVQLIQRA